MLNAIVYVLISIHVHNSHLIKEYQSTFSTQNKCNAVMTEMNRATVGNSWYCEKHIVE